LIYDQHVLWTYSRNQLFTNLKHRVDPKILFTFLVPLPTVAFTTASWFGITKKQKGHLPWCEGTPVFCLTNLRLWWWQYMLVMPCNLASMQRLGMQVA